MVCDEYKTMLDGVNEKLNLSSKELCKEQTRYKSAAKHSQVSRLLFLSATLSIYTVFKMIWERYPISNIFFYILFGSQQLFELKLVELYSSQCPVILHYSNSPMCDPPPREEGMAIAKKLLHMDLPRLIFLYLNDLFKIYFNGTAHG